MSSRKRSKSVPSRRPRSSRSDAESITDTPEPDIRPPSADDDTIGAANDKETVDVYEANDGHGDTLPELEQSEGGVGLKSDVGHKDGGIFVRFSNFTRSISGKDKKDRMKNKMHDLEEELKQTKRENEIYSAGLEDLQKALEQSPLSSCINLGPINIQVGGGSNKIIVVDQAKESIANLTEMIEELLGSNAVLQQTVGRNEKMLQEIQETLNQRSSNKLDRARLDQLLKEAIDTQTDAQVLFDGIKALREAADHNRMITDYNSMPDRGRRAIGRVVNKYGTAMDCKQLAEQLDVVNAAPLQSMVTDKSVRFDKDSCAKIVLEWTKNPDNTPDKFVGVTTEIDQFFLIEKTAALKKELIQKKQRMSVSSDQSYDSHVTPGRPGTKLRRSNDSMNVQHQRNQMAHIAELAQYVLEVHGKVDGIPPSMEEVLTKLTKLETNQRTMMTMIGSANEDRPHKGDVDGIMGEIVA